MTAEHQHPELGPRVNQFTELAGRYVVAKQAVLAKVLTPEQLAIVEMDRIESAAISNLSPKEWDNWAEKFAISSLGFKETHDEEWAAATPVLMAYRSFEERIVPSVEGFSFCFSDTKGVPVAWFGLIQFRGVKGRETPTVQNVKLTVVAGELVRTSEQHGCERPDLPMPDITEDNILGALQVMTEEVEWLGSLESEEIRQRLGLSFT